MQWCLVGLVWANAATQVQIACWFIHGEIQRAHVGSLCQLVWVRFVSVACYQLEIIDGSIGRAEFRVLTGFVCRPFRA